MRNNKIFKVPFLLLGFLLIVGTGFAQQTHQSVLAEHTWIKMAVAQEGIYKLDYATLAAMNVDMERLNPNEIRIFGNPSGALPEKNSEVRPDDLTELALYVSGADDGSFDEGDFVLFYGQEPTRWNLLQNSNKVYGRDRNYYTDSTYYFLCVDSGVAGLRIGSQASMPVDDVTAVITEFPDFTWHDEELFSPNNICRNWFGEALTNVDSLLRLDFVLPNLIKDKPVYIKTEVMGHSMRDSMRYYLWANNNMLVNYGGIAKAGDYTYGQTSTSDKMILSESDTIQMTLKLCPADNGPILYLDYIEMYYWRRLIREGAFFPFRIAPSQFGSGNSAVWVQNVSAGCQLWDVSEPLRPMVQEGILSADNFVFATDTHAERRYALFSPAAIRPIDSWKAIANQNLHALEGVDMLIITSPLFWEQANELARFHQQADGLTSHVVDVNEIYNEFSTGIPDPTGIRDFIRMVFLRGGQLQYVTLFGRPSFDYCSRLGFHSNFVPCYEPRSGAETLMSEGTDDFFGLMGASEGLSCVGHVDIGVGRLPVSTTAEADAVIRKIKTYNDLALTHGDWKLSYLALTDDVVWSYIETNEINCSILDTICPALNPVKVYCGAYPHVSTSSGIRIPQATDDLMETFNKGIMLMNYAGHGGVKGLTGDNVFTVSDITALRNGDKMPFVFTATCEFSKYDDPLLLSAGEQMFLLPDNGPVAMLTTTRPTVATNNKKISQVLMNELCRKDEQGRGLRFGDIVRKTKSSDASGYSNTTDKSNNLNYVLLGDPALRLALPQEDIATLRVNGRDPANNVISIHAMSVVTIEGEIRTLDGLVDPLFNGELWVTMYDRKSNIAVPYSNGVANVSYHKDKLYHGRVSVSAGKFSIAFQVPKDIKPDSGEPRFAYYAYDSIRNIDAMGVFSNLILGGTDPAMQPDNEGPQISFYWNTPSFQNGDVAERQGVLYADLYDAQGIYHYDFSLGRDMVLNSNFSIYDNLILNDLYEPELNDYRRGRIAIPVSGLTEGTYEFDLKVWDMQNNSSTAHLWLVVGGDVFLAGVRNYPNPFNEETRITMSHVGKGGSFHVVVEMFDVLGRNVARLTKQVVSTGDGELEPIVWNGRDQWGNMLPTGIYLYRLTLTDEDGFSRTVSQRLMISR